MKATFCLTLFLALTFCCQATAPIPGDPIPGVPVMVGRKPPGSNNIIASTTTGNDGTFSFKNLTSGDYTYFVVCGFKEKVGKDMSAGMRIMNTDGTKASDENYRIEGIVLPQSTNGMRRSKAPSPTITKTVDTVEYGPVVISITYDSKSIKGSASKANGGMK